jgi:hypothetical protein
MTWQDVYWLTRLDAIKGIFTAIGILSIIASMVFLVVGACIRDSWSIDDERIAYEKKTSMKWIMRAIPSGIAAFIFISMSVLCPTTKEAAVIYILPKVVNNEQVQNIPAKGLKILEAKFDEWLDGMTKEKTEKP